MCEKDNKSKAKKEDAKQEAMRVFDEQKSVLELVEDIRNGRS